VLTPHGSLVFELGDTYSGSGGAGGDYNEGGMREEAPRFSGSALSYRKSAVRNRYSKRYEADDIPRTGPGRTNAIRESWPLDKSLCLIPELFSIALSYGLNPLNGRTTDRWRVRNVIAWVRPNPPVGSLSDKCRPATSYLTVATKARDRWFDMDAVRVPHQTSPDDRRKQLPRDTQRGVRPEGTGGAGKALGAPSESGFVNEGNPAGAPLLDWWEIPTQPFSGSHYATFPDELARRVILLMCPTKVCLECGKPSRRIVEGAYLAEPDDSQRGKKRPNSPAIAGSLDHPPEVGWERSRTTIGWTDCLHGAFRPGIVLDPFAGSGTTLAMAQGNGRSSIGIDLDSRNTDLALDRVGPLYMTVERFKGEALPAAADL